MRKKSTRLLSAALAVCMMVSVLPVGAFALEPGEDATNAVVSTQEETKTYHLQGGEKINDDFVKDYGSTYTIGGEGDYLYTNIITIDTNQDVTIKFINNVNCDIKGTSADLIPALKYQRSFISAKKVGKLIISNEGNYKFDNPRWGGRFLGVTAPNAIVEVNGGIYRSYAVGTFYFNGCNATLTDVTVNNYQYECVYNDNATVTIDRGSYTAKKGLAISNNSGGTLDLNNVKAVGTGVAVLNEGGNVTINGGRYTNSIVDGDCSGCSAVENDYLPVLGYETTMTILDGEFETKGRNAAAIASSTRSGNADHGWLEIKGGTFTASKDGGKGIYAKNGISRIENATIKGCQYGICCGVPGSDNSQVTIKDVLFEDNTNDVYQDRAKNYRIGEGLYAFDYPLVEIEEGRNEVITAGTDDTFVGRDDVVGGDIKGRQFTTETNSHYQKDLKLVSTDPNYIIDYQKNDDGTEYRYFNTREADKYYVNPIHATMKAEDGTEKRPYSQFKKGDKVFLTAFSNEEGKKCTGWKVEKIAAEGVTELYDVVDYDHENPETATLTVPEGDVFVTAEYENVIVDPGTSDTDYGGDIAAGVVIGGIAAVGAYEVGTGLYRITQMDDVAMPANRIALAKLMWERAGKPEPESTALYSDIIADDTDTQKAARWAVEQELLKDDISEDEQKFHPAFPVSKLRVCLTWEKAKQKGLFDQNTEA